MSYFIFDLDETLINQRYSTFEAELKKIEDAISNRAWDDVIQLAREGLILDPNNELFNGISRQEFVEFLRT